MFHAQQTNEVIVALQGFQSIASRPFMRSLLLDYATKMHMAFQHITEVPMLHRVPQQGVGETVDW